MNIFKFKADNTEETVNIIVKYITSYGISVSKFINGCPVRALIWINTGTMNYNQDVSYQDALAFEEEINEAVRICFD